MLQDRSATVDFASFQVQTDKNLGVIEVGVFVSLILFGILLAQAYSFFFRRREDTSGLKLLVSSLVFLETVHTSLAAAAVYYDTVTTWRHPAINTYPLSVATIVENLITTMVQLFFAYRIRRIAQGRSLAAFACFVLAVLRSIGVFAVGVIAIREVISDGGTGIFVVRVSWLITTGLTVGGVADLLIAASMIYYLRKLSSPTDLKSTGQILKRLMRWSVQTGLLTSLAHLTTVICFQTMEGRKPYPNRIHPITKRPRVLLVWLAIYIVLAKLYSNSLLMMLNASPQKGIAVSLYDAPSSDIGAVMSGGDGTERTIPLLRLSHNASSLVKSLMKTPAAQLPPIEVAVTVERA
ncbi:unnamed protein product [Cyclocybe aegerita]|uniref:DUF6534 domain-containing protein n=1 Tax=Cyclocybe aegerita TaxID=1973307 RepID=A0A8S0VTM1_CYCAE|nr:unnamed protein product [Cyclocybe aegerita]